PLQDVERLAAFARMSSGEVIGGAIGRTWGECCELQQVWVNREHRRKGVATRVVKAFEQEALSRGCRTFYLETFSFQVPELYRKLGYQVGFELAGFPEGIVKYVMVKHDR
ncbi:MAG TPA: GNAT family N-acetyltransferase, partial [Casimicrobiaceae bacterium]